MREIWLPAILGVALAGAAHADPGDTPTGAVRDPRAIVGKWVTSSFVDRSGLYDVRVAFQLNRDGTYSATTRLTPRRGVIFPGELPREPQTIAGAGTWRLARDGTFTYTDQ